MHTKRRWCAVSIWLDHCRRSVIADVIQPQFQALSMTTFTVLAALPLWRILLLLVIYLFFFAIIAGLVYFLYSGGSKNLFRHALFKNYDGLEVHKTRQPGDVELKYHTYRGFFLWFIQEEHHVYAPRHTALALLRRLLKFNLTYGLMSSWPIFVPFLAIGNYYAQKKRIGY